MKGTKMKTTVSSIISPQTRGIGIVRGGDGLIWYQNV